MRDVPVASRTGGVEYAIRDLVVAARRVEAQGRDVLYLNIGDPDRYDFAPPPHVREAWARAAADPRAAAYAPSEGLPALREAVALREGLSPEDVIVTAGMSEGIRDVVAALLDPGDEVLLPSPCYPLYQAVTRLYEGRPVFHRCDPRTWQPDLEDVARRVGPRTRLLVVIDPNNPTGAVYGEATLAGLVAIADRAGIPIFLDQAYDGMTFAPRGPDLKALRGGVPVVVGYSMSKVFLAPGARCGYLAFHGRELAGLRDAVLRLARARLSTNHPAQHAFLAALTGPMDFLGDVLARLRERAALTARRLAAMPGVSLTPPAAAFYAFPRLDRSVWADDRAFVLDLLETAGVLAVHGAGFSDALDGPYFRVVYLPPPETLAAAYDRLDAFLRERLGGAVAGA